MPRVTRAALRTNSILEDEANLAAATPLPSTPTVSRTPFGEVAGNVYGDSANVEEPDEALKLAKKGGAAKGRKAKGAKKGRKKNDVEKENQVEVLEDPYQSSASSAVEEACEDLLKEDLGEMYQIPMHDSRPQTPTSKAVQAALKQLSPKSHTPRFDPEVHRTPKSENTPDNEAEDSFVNTIGTRTPAPVTHNQPAEEELHDKPGVEELEVAKDDSFTEHIAARSPVKADMRIEDTVEALDALEEAIERVSESIPVIIEDRLSPVKISHVEKKKQTPTLKDQVAVSKGLTTKKSTAASSRTKRTPAAKQSTSDMRRKDSIKRSSLNVSAPTTSAKVSLTPRIVAAKPTPTKKSTRTLKLAKSNVVSTTAASIDESTSDTATIHGKHSRISSISKAPFIPQRSTKAPTRPTFTLPGDVISQKLKLQREERLRREEEENSKKREFKAKPVRMSLAPVVKSTTASRARTSLMKGNASGDSYSVLSRKESPGGKATTSGSRISSTSSTVSNLNGHNATRSSGPPNGTSQVKANISAPRAPSLALPTRSTGTTKGKEVFGRALAEQEAREAARKEKEEAAKKARAEAAERGRIASREWAEKMKARKEKEKNGAALAA